MTGLLLGRVHFKRMQDMSKDELILAFDMDTGKAVVRLPDLKLKTLGERGIECIFVGYVEHYKDFSFYAIKPNELVAINLIIKLKDAIFDENRFSSVPRPSLNIPKGTKDIGGSVFPEVVTDEVVQQYEFELRKSKRNRTPKDFGPEFQLYLIEGTKDEDAAFWKEAINDEMSSIMGNNTWVLADLPPGCKPLSCKWIFKRKPKYLIAMASIHNMIIHQMDVKTAFLNGDLDEEVYMNQPQGFIMPGNENKDHNEDTHRFLEKIINFIKKSDIKVGMRWQFKSHHNHLESELIHNQFQSDMIDQCFVKNYGVAMEEKMVSDSDALVQDKALDALIAYLKAVDANVIGSYDKMSYG
ncbi:zinc finger, CCHC-type containing protein [Tanacetum coccineum]